MATEIIIPKLSQTMEEAKVVEWLKSEEDWVEVGESIVVVETDKAEVEIEAPSSGMLGKILAAAGEVAAVGETIAYIIEPAEAVPGGDEAGD